MPVHLRHAVFIFEVGRVPQTPQQIFRTLFTRQFCCKLRVRQDLDPVVARECLRDALHHHFDREVSRTFLAVVPDSNYDLVKNFQPTQYNVLVTFREGVEGAREKCYTLHNKRCIEYRSKK